MIFIGFVSVISFYRTHLQCTNLFQHGFEKKLLKIFLELRENSYINRFFFRQLQMFNMNYFRVINNILINGETKIAKNYHIEK